jgi:hypothetical protein
MLLFKPELLQQVFTEMAMGQGPNVIACLLTIMSKAGLLLSDLLKVKHWDVNL